ncbi:MAG: hypothetical protein BGO49_08230 [Planctomycetales bacterium 71-10]|nr:MAG: hypothetical protein BGO49_08230 [Planctomycetales bacterium 71-10]
MTESGAEGTQGPSPSELARIADACARFEAAWGRGERPSIEESLAAAGPEAGSILSHLLPLELSLRLGAGESPSPGEYLSRFPGSRGLVEAAFADHTTVADATAAAPPRPPTGAGTASNLLVGILALQNGFIDHVALIAAIRAWAADRSRGVGAILAAEGKLDDRQIRLLEALAEEHRRRYGDDLPRSLAAFGSLAPVMRAVEGMGDPEVEAGLTIEPESTVVDEEATTAHGAPPGDAPSAEPGSGWSASRFEVLSFHNAGMLGKVFLALDRELNRNVALKEIQERHAHHPVSREQFVLEGMVTGALEHPGIVPVYSLGAREDGSPFYAMRFIQGPSLREKLKQLHDAADAPPLADGEERPTLPRLLRHFVNACHAMAYAHSRGVLHRDLKPEHVLLGPFGETLVVDWGLAMPIRGGPGATGVPLEFPTGRDAALAQDGVVVGTLPYMSPEQALGMQGRLDGRSDVYALGAILYALLTGRAPIAGGSFATMLAQARKGEFPRPREVARQAPPALEAVCLKAMSHDPADRYATATELARDVERWLDDEPTVAYPEPLAARAGRWLRRHRTAAVAAAVALLCTTVGLAALSFQTSRANVEIRRQWKRAEDARAEAVTARDQAEAARVRVERNFRTSIELVNQYLLRIVRTDLPNVPESVLLRRNVASLATGFLEELWKQKPDDPETCRLAAVLYRELANLQRLVGRTLGPAYGRAVGLLRRAGALRPDEPRYRDLLAETLQDLASSLQVENRPAAAEPHLREAVQIVRGLRGEAPDRVDYLRTEARASNGLANNLLLTGRFDEAADLARRAVAIMTPLADSDAPGPTDALEVILYQDSLGEAELGRSRHPEAEAALGAALRRIEAALAGSPDSDDLKMLRGSARLKRAAAVAALGRADEATEDLGAAVAEFGALAERSAEMATYRELLAEALLARAEMSPPGPARADLARAEETVDALAKGQKDDPAYSGLLGRIRGRAAMLDAAGPDPGTARARLEGALSLLRSALKVNDKHPASLRAAAEFEAKLKALGAPAE